MTEEDADPFSPHNLAISTWITTARVYDVLLALLTEQNPSMAKNLIELHAAGNLMGPQPSFNGVFITDEVNSKPEEDSEAENSRSTN